MKRYRLFQPDKLRFAQTAAFALVAVGGFAYLAFTCVSAIKEAMNGVDPVKHDQAILQQVHPSTNPNVPVEQRIAEREALIAQLTDPKTIQAQKQLLASLYDEQGLSFLSGDRLGLAEQSFQTALALDQTHPEYSSDLAGLYARAAVRQSETDPKVRLLKNSSQYYQTAAAYEPDSVKRAALVGKEADASYQLGQEELREPGSKASGILDLEKAKDLAGPGSKIALSVDQVLSQVR